MLVHSSFSNAENVSVGHQLTISTCLRCFQEMTFTHVCAMFAIRQANHFIHINLVFEWIARRKEGNEEKSNRQSVPEVSAVRRCELDEAKVIHKCTVRRDATRDDIDDIDDVLRFNNIQHSVHNAFVIGPCFESLIET